MYFNCICIMCVRFAEPQHISGRIHKQRCTPGIALGKRNFVAGDRDGKRENKFHFFSLHYVSILSILKYRH